MQLVKPITDCCSQWALASEDVVVHAGQNVQLIVPKNPLTAGSVRVIANAEQSLSEWQGATIQESYQMLQRVVRAWDSQGIKDFMIFGKECVIAGTQNPKFYWEIVPYRRYEGRIWRCYQQFKVLWNIAFGAFRISRTAQEAIATQLRSTLKPEQELASPPRAAAPACCAFCNTEKVIKKQRVIEAAAVNVLLNHRPFPIDDKKLHFLVTAKEHANFPELTEQEYIEGIIQTKRLIEFYKMRGYPIVYLFDKTGKAAHQTVDHWHRQMIFATSKIQVVKGLAIAFFRTVTGRSSQLSVTELDRYVGNLKTDFQAVV